ncbi:MAG TPA: chorismate mutase, partial [Stellaceae bacterium]|nr:chorismate mutase [Stellaceae bacterium]
VIPLAPPITMPTPKSPLDRLRASIDRVDDQIHDLLMKRATLVEQVAAHKKDTAAPVFRPGREALILRRLIERHEGSFPRPVLIRIWREIIAGSIAIQGQASIAVFAPDQLPGYWDLARDHFGAHAAMIPILSAGEVIYAVAEGRAQVGVLPMPVDGERAPWWPPLMAMGAQAPFVIARLPFGVPGNARRVPGDVLVIGRGEPEPTGADRSLLLIETGAELSRNRLITQLGAQGLEVTLFAAIEPDPDHRINLLEIDDFVTATDQRLARALDPIDDRVLRASRLGSYAKPLKAALLIEERG